MSDNGERRCVEEDSRRSHWLGARSQTDLKVWSPNAFKVSVNNPATDGDNSAHTWLTGSTGSRICHSVYASVVRHGRPIRPGQNYRAQVPARGVSKEESIFTSIIDQRKADTKEKQ